MIELQDCRQAQRLSALVTSGLLAPFTDSLAVSNRGLLTTARIDAKMVERRWTMLSHLPLALLRGILIVR